MNEQVRSSSISDIAFRIAEIKSPTRSDLKSIIDSLNRSPSAENFWVLSRCIRLAPPPEVKAVIDQIAKLVLNNRLNFVGAVFANAHLLRVAHNISYPDGYKWCRNFCFTNNIVWNAQIYNIISLPTYSNILSAQYSFLDSFNIEIQKKGAASIARHSKTPGNLLRRVLATISSKPPSDAEIKILQLPDISNLEPDVKFCRLRGLVILASFLTSNPISLSEYKSALIPILQKIPESDMEKSLAAEVQNLLSKLMISNPTSFHNTNIFDAAIVQVKSNNFAPFFLNGIICSFGFYAFKKFIIPLIPIWLDDIKKDGFEFIKVISPYTKYLDPQLQLQIQEVMMDLCDANRFDFDVFDTAAVILMGSNPTMSPYIGQFIEIAKRSACARYIISKLKPILEPKVQPVLHPMREVMKVRELEKRDAFAQANPAVKSVLISCDMSREKIFLPKKETPKKSTPLFNFSKANASKVNNSVTYKSDKKNELNEPKVNNNKDESSDSDLELNLDGPDSEDVE